MKKTFSFSTRNQRGVAAVEFAVVLPLLVLLLFGIIEFSVLLYDKNVLTNASREGARFGILSANPRHNPMEITTVVNAYCGSNLITFDEIPTPPVIKAYRKSAGASGYTEIASTTPVCNVSGVLADDLRVDATYTYKFLVMPELVTDILPTMNLTATTVMKCE